MFPQALTVFVDGGCAVCSREMVWLTRLDKHGQLSLVDVSEADFDAHEAAGVEHLELMRRIHARLPSGELIVGVEVFRQIYSRLGFLRLVTVSRLPGVRWLLTLAYEAFAAWRFKARASCQPVASASRAR